VGFVVPELREAVFFLRGSPIAGGFVLGFYNAGGFVAHSSC
jgi:hypothetical protein